MLDRIPIPSTFIDPETNEVDLEREFTTVSGNEDPANNIDLKEELKLIEEQDVSDVWDVKI